MAEATNQQTHQASDIFKELLNWRRFFYLEIYAIYERAEEEKAAKSNIEYVHLIRGSLANCWTITIVVYTDNDRSVQQELVCSC